MSKITNGSEGFTPTHQIRSWCAPILQRWNHLALNCWNQILYSDLRRTKVTVKQLILTLSYVVFSINCNSEFQNLKFPKKDHYTAACKWLYLQKQRTTSPKRPIYGGIHHMRYRHQIESWHLSFSSSHMGASHRQAKLEDAVHLALADLDLSGGFCSSIKILTVLLFKFYAFLFFYFLDQFFTSSIRLLEAELAAIKYL